MLTPRNVRATAAAPASTTLVVRALKRVEGMEQVVEGAVYIPNSLDTQGEFLLPEDVELVARRFMEIPDLTKVIDINHDRLARQAHPIESWVTKTPYRNLPVGTWILRIKVEDTARATSS